MPRAGCLKVCCKARLATGDRCYRPVKEQGLCALHLGIKRRKEKEEENERLRLVAAKMVAQLSAHHIDARPYASGCGWRYSGWRYDGTVVIEDPRKLIRLLNRLSKAASHQVS